MRVPAPQDPYHGSLDTINNLIENNKYPKATEEASLLLKNLEEKSLTESPIFLKALQARLEIETSRPDILDIGVNGCITRSRELLRKARTFLRKNIVKTESNLR